jgi:hypothetical protein
MSRFTGILQISQNQSSVNGNILLMSGVADPNQAMSSATSFVQGKGFRNGYRIVVIGELGQVVSISGIIMTDAVAPLVTAPKLAPVPVAAVEPAATAVGVSRAAKKKTAARKKAATPKKKAAPKKKVASKKEQTRTKGSPRRKAARKKSNRPR